MLEHFPTFLLAEIPPRQLVPEIGPLSHLNFACRESVSRHHAVLPAPDSKVAAQHTCELKCIASKTAGCAQNTKRRWNKPQTRAHKGQTFCARSRSLFQGLMLLRASIKFGRNPAAILAV